jgi:UDP-N-acetylmuramyl pentapeptide phosphotransferase/UDP-N-acetylglucosamine-1-phosphate transferase
VAQSHLLMGLILCALPVFAAGLGEDAGWPVGPIWRLAASVCSSFLVIVVFGAAITRVGVAPLDGIFAFPLPSLFLTALVLTGVTQAFNMVDGLHGLCGFASLIAGGALALIGLKSGQDQAVQALWIVMAAMGGFLLVNFPRGLLFLGDAGAYLTGFVLACIAVKMLQEQPDLSPWAVVLVFFWPLADMVFAVARRMGQRRSAFRADKMHGHHVVLRSLEILGLGKKWGAVSNPLATLILLPAMIAPAALGVVFWNQNGRACALVVAAMICFVLAYRSLVAAAKRRRFRTIGGAGRGALKQNTKVGHFSV